MSDRDLENEVSVLEAKVEMLQEKNRELGVKNTELRGSLDAKADIQCGAELKEAEEERETMQRKIRDLESRIFHFSNEKAHLKRRVELLTDSCRNLLNIISPDEDTY